MKKVYLLIIACAVVLTSCFDDPGTEILFDDTFVELDAAGISSNTRTYTLLRENDGMPKDPEIKVLLASRPLDEAVTVTLAVDPASDAIEGLHYRLNSNTVTIPAQQNIALVDIDVFPDNIEAGETLDLILKISDASVDINTALDSAVHTLQISCPVENTDFVGDYEVTIDQDGAFNGNSAFGPTGTVVTFDRTDATTRSVEANFIGNSDFPVTYSFAFVCEEVKLERVDTGLVCTATATDNIFVDGRVGTFGSYDDASDLSFTLLYLEDTDDSCGGGPQEAAITFTRVP